MKCELKFKECCLKCDCVDVFYELIRYTDEMEPTKRFYCSHKEICKKYDADNRCSEDK